MLCGAGVVDPFGERDVGSVLEVAGGVTPRELPCGSEVFGSYLVAECPSLRLDVMQGGSRGGGGDVGPEAAPAEFVDGAASVEQVAGQGVF